MQRYIHHLKNNYLFTGICTENIGRILEYSNAELCSFKNGDYILRKNNQLNRIAVFLKGRAQIINEDFRGNRTVLDEIGSGEIFGEAHSLLQYDLPSVSVAAISPVEVIFMDIACILEPIAEISECQSRMRSNLMRIMAKKLIKHAHKIEHISQRSTRQKLLSYFTEQMNRQQSRCFDLPYTRQQLADYLSVDRSAMSSELSRMQKDGLIRYNLNHFELITDEDVLS